MHGKINENKKYGKIFARKNHKIIILSGYVIKKGKHIFVKNERRIKRNNI